METLQKNKIPIPTRDANIVDRTAQYVLSELMSEIKLSFERNLELLHSRDSMA